MLIHEDAFHYNRKPLQRYENYLPLVSYKLVFLIFIMNLTSCSEDQEPTSGHLKRDIKSSMPAPPAFPLPSKELPYTDSTNFDNYSSVEKHLVPHQLLAAAETAAGKHTGKIYVSHTLDLSPDFTTMVISYYRGDAELLTVMVNCDPNGKAIDWLEIAYDEVAEGWVRKYSTVSRDRVLVEKTSYISEPPEVTTAVYRIGGNGKFIRNE